MTIATLTGNLILRPMGAWGEYYRVRDTGFRTVPVGEVVRIGKYNTKGHGDGYCVELTDGTVGHLVLKDNDKATVKAIRPYLDRVPTPGGLRMPPMLAWGKPMSEPPAPPPTDEERAAARRKRRGEDAAFLAKLGVSE